VKESATPFVAPLSWFRKIGAAAQAIHFARRWVPFTFYLMFVTVVLPTNLSSGPRFTHLSSYKEPTNHAYEASPEEIVRRAAISDPYRSDASAPDPVRRCRGCA
jgi:hypothetical protein